MKPKYVEVTCIICNHEAVALEIDEGENNVSAVEWCKYGHVVVRTSNGVKEVFNFDKV
jgi:hypothetical protein